MLFIPLPYPPTQKVTVFKTVDECVEGSLRSSYERSGVCFGGFRLRARSRSRLREAPASAGVGRSAKAGPTKHAEEPRLRAVTQFGVQARASARGSSTLGGASGGIINWTKNA
jgi:hypothetical protein